DLVASKCRRGNDPAAHLVDQAEHLLVVRPGAFLDSVSLESLWRRSARLVERGNEALSVGDLGGHIGGVHGSPFIVLRGLLQEAKLLQSLTTLASKSYRVSAATPGNSLPSIHSRNAPPAVEMKVMSSATPAWLSAATVSPPPATDTSEPSFVSAAAVCASATVAVSKGGVSNAPI